MQVLRMLDIDLDAFLGGTAHWVAGHERLDGSEYRPWSEEQLRDFLEHNCRLSRNTRVRGRFAIEHDAALPYWEDLAADFDAMFDVVHIDGHADLGLGDPSWVHLMTQWLSLPPTARRNPPRGRKCCNPGSYLAYAIAARLVSELSYVHPQSGGGDLHQVFFKDNQTQSGFLQLKLFPNGVEAEEYELLTADRAASVEPAIPYHEYLCAEFLAAAPFDFAFVCQSPGFTPADSDMLLPILAEYIDFDSGSDPLPIAPF